MKVRQNRVQPNCDIVSVEFALFDRSLPDYQMHEEDSGSLVDLFNLSKELKVPLTPNSAILLIRYFFCVKKIQECLQLYDELDPDAKNNDVKNTLLGFAVEMKKAGFLMDLVTYNTLIGGFFRKKKLDKAVEILKDMEDSGIKPDSVTYNTLISYFTQNDDFESAHKFLKQMVKDG
ncbi:hypothetical protein L1887_34265 [Cichorium endivia]|nr:hypothetical protein L1887_34265 [Cichorium endivia]